MDQGLVILFSFLDVTIPFIIIYNKLVRARNYVKNAFAQIDVQLTRRYDLIPNLVESVKAYMKHERATLEAVIQARNQALQSVKTAGHNPADAQKIEQLSQAESNLNRAMGSFFALFEQYPDLKANTTINQLMEELISTENKVAFARQGFNDMVTAYNNLRESFPNTIVANIFNFSPAQVLKVDDPKKREAIKIQFE